MTQINNDTILQRFLDVMKANIDEEMVLMSIEEGKYFAVNHVAKMLWDKLENPISFDMLCQKTAMLFDVAAEPNYRQAILEFLNKMVEQKLVKIIE